MRVNPYFIVLHAGLLVAAVTVSPWFVALSVALLILAAMAT